MLQIRVKGAKPVFAILGALVTTWVFTLFAASSASAGYDKFCWGVQFPGGGTGAVPNICDSYYHDGVIRYIDEIGGSGKDRSVCVLAWFSDGSMMCSGGPNQGVYNFSPKGEYLSIGQINNNASGSNVVYAYIGSCSGPCEGEGPGGTPPTVPPPSPPPPSPMYRYMLGTSNGSGVATWGAILNGMSLTASYSVGDLTGDGKADIVAVEPAEWPKFRYMLGTSNGSGVATWGAILNGMSTAEAMSVGDLTGDGKADIVAMESEGGGSEPKRRYMLGTSTGSGVTWSQILSGMSYATNMSVGDVTGDGKADIVAVESEGSGSGKYRYMLGTSTGSGVTWKQILSGMSEAQEMSVGDLTGDGKADIVAVEKEGSGKYRYMLGTSTGSGVTWSQILSGMSNATRMSVGDVTGDGKADIVAVEFEGSGKYRYMLGTSTGSGVTWSQILSGMSNGTLFVSDFTGDGKADIVAKEQE